MCAEEVISSVGDFLKVVKRFSPGMKKFFIVGREMLFMVEFQPLSLVR
jgi:hypothetical protein